MTDFETMQKIRESKAINDRYGKSHDVAGLTLHRKARSLSRWKIKQSSVSKVQPQTFNWSKSLQSK